MNVPVRMGTKANMSLAVMKFMIMRGGANMATYIALNEKAARAQAPLLEPDDTILVEPGTGLTAIIIVDLHGRGLKTTAEVVNEFQRWLADNDESTSDKRIAAFDRIIPGSVTVEPVR